MCTTDVSKGTQTLFLLLYDIDLLFDEEKNGNDWVFLLKKKKRLITWSFACLFVYISPHHALAVHPSPFFELLCQVWEVGVGTHTLTRAYLSLRVLQTFAMPARKLKN